MMENRDAINALEDGYNFHYKSGFLLVENPNYQPDNGENPFLIIGLKQDCAMPTRSDLEQIKHDTFLDIDAPQNLEQEHINAVIDYLHSRSLIKMRAND